MVESWRMDLRENLKTPDGLEYELPPTNEVQFGGTEEKKPPTPKVLNVKDHAFPSEIA